MKAPKKSKVDTSLSPVNTEFAIANNITDTDRDINDNSPSINVDANSNRATPRGYSKGLLQRVVPPFIGFLPSLDYSFIQTFFS